MNVLVVNAGSSSYKLSLYDMRHEHPINPLWKGTVECGQTMFTVSLAANGQNIKHTFHSVEEGLNALVNGLWEGATQVIDQKSEIHAIGHRVVHGGQEFEQPVRIDAAVKARIRELIPLAPLHNPLNLNGIELMETLFPLVPQFAVFDTAFHAHMPRVAQTYPLPYAWKDEGIQRYGFHGISHAYCAKRAATLLGKKPEELKIVNCHLGNGSSLCAIKNGKSIATTMGFTPLEGLMMGTRCGSIDPGILLYMLREGKQTAETLERILNFESGLKGICGASDMRDIVNSQDARAKLALQMFIYHLRAYLGAYLVHLEGSDVISFTGGIGENVPLVRQGACSGLAFMGIEMDEVLNLETAVQDDKVMQDFELESLLRGADHSQEVKTAPIKSDYGSKDCVNLSSSTAVSRLNVACQLDQDIARSRSRTRILVIHTQEEWMIAHCIFEMHEV